MQYSQITLTACTQTQVYSTTALSKSHDHAKTGMRKVITHFNHCTDLFHLTSQAE